MKSLVRIVSIAIIASAFFACSSTLHLYSGQQYLSDEELGTLKVAEQIHIYKFDRKEVYKTKTPPVIKALPGQHQLELAVNSFESDWEKDQGNLNQRIIFWDAVEGHTYQLMVSDSDDNNVLIVDITDETSL